MSEETEFDPVDHVTVGALGPPGRRTFYLQARQGSEVTSWVVEKEHVVALAEGAEELLSRVGYPEPPQRFDEDAMALHEPVEPAFRVGRLRVGYVEERDLVFVECDEMPAEEGTETETATARLWLTRAQFEALGKQGLAVAAKGRPLCPLCGVPMDPEGHRCFAMNGHRDEA